MISFTNAIKIGIKIVDMNELAQFILDLGNSNHIERACMIQHPQALRQNLCKAVRCDMIEGSNFYERDGSLPRNSLSLVHAPLLDSRATRPTHTLLNISNTR